MNAWSLYATKGKGMTPSQRTALRHNAAVGATALQTMLARADVAFARNLLRPTYMKGAMGEFFAENFFLNNQLEQDIRGHWIPLTPRSGPQGLDHLFMKTGKNGHLYWMVGESKYVQASWESPSMALVNCQRSGLQNESATLALNTATLPLTALS